MILRLRLKLRAWADHFFPLPDDETKRKCEEVEKPDRGLHTLHHPGGPEDDPTSAIRSPIGRAAGNLFWPGNPFVKIEIEN
jgi:hypothetical protein